jgi:type IV pilus assembly protein PilN
VIRINLLPHREEKRRARRTQFYTLGGGILLLGGLTVFLVHSIIAGYISTQESKNEFLKKEIAGLDKEIEEIKRLKEQTDALLSRKQVIETLQANRAEAVHLFNELARQVPDGVYLSTVKQTGQRVAVTGFSQSNARVSTLMRNLDASPFLEQPGLVEIKANSVGARRVSDFSVNVAITRATTGDKKPAAGQPGPTPGKTGTQAAASPPPPQTSSSGSKS